MEETISITEESSVASQLSPATRVVCHVCKKQFSQYTCPRCNSRYCSLHCYKTHSLRCTESFMRDNVMEELGQLEPEDATKKKMLEILKRFHSKEDTDEMEEDTDNEESSLSEEIFEKILSGGQITFDDLSTEEKKRFQRALASGDLSKMIEPWDPWWLKPSAKTLSLSQEGGQLVKPFTASTSENQEQYDSTELPAGPEAPLPPIGRLITSEPSPVLPIHLVDILYSYCFTVRVYNGDWQSDALESAMVALSMSSVFDQGGQQQTLMKVISHCLEQTCSPAYRHMGGGQFALGLLDDIITLLSLGRSALICSLCDLQRMFQTGERELKSERSRKLKAADVKRKLKRGDRKIYFMMCWVNEQPKEAWTTLAAAVNSEKCLAATIAADNGSNKGRVLGDASTKRLGKVLIEEIQ